MPTRNPPTQPNTPLQPTREKSGLTSPGSWERRGCKLYLLVILSAVLPGLFVILRLNLFAAWMIVLITESAGSDPGLGALIMLARNTAAANLVMIGIVILGALGWIFDIVLRAIQNRMLLLGA